jgi:cytochrome c oxidase subunit 2
MMHLLLPEASSFAPRVDNLIDLIFFIVTFWLVLALVIFFYFIIRYSRKRNPKAGYITGETPEESKWVHWAHYFVIACDLVIIFFSMRVWYHIKQELPPADSTIRVVGEQWAWRFTDPGADNQLDTADDINTIDELHVEVNKVYHFKLEAKDVLHSFSIPAFRFKQDAVPGRVITGWFKPTRLGQYDIQCSQMCGIGHGIMGGRVFVETAEEHAAWMKAHSPQATAAAPAKDPSPVAANAVPVISSQK